MNTEPPLTVLVVDDNFDVAQSAAWLIEMYGHTVRVALSGEEALAAALIDPPDVALVDIRMPGMDGYALTRRLREVCGKELLIVVVSGCGAAAEVDRSYEVGANLHLVKPVNPTVLRDILQSRAGALVDVCETAGLTQSVR
jgi:CheY-like chemotaxis protein